MSTQTHLPSISGKASVEFIRGDVEDKEFYPTTDEIIQVVKSDINSLSGYKMITLLDIGAGDGRVLSGIMETPLEDGTCDTRRMYEAVDYKKQSAHKLMGIEQSDKLMSLWHKDIIPVGSDFFDTNLMSISAKFTFTNPPFTKIEPWITKVVYETQSQHCYFVAPERWRNSTMIEEAINKRNGKVTSLGVYSFKDGDRAVREGRDMAELFRIDFGSRGTDEFIEPLRLFLEERLGNIEEQIPDHRKYSVETRLKNSLERAGVKNALVTGNDYVSAMVELYNAEQAKIYDAMEKFQSIDSTLFSAIGVSTYDAMMNMRKELDNLRSQYWVELYRNTREISELVDTETSYAFEALMKSQTNLEFNQSNIRMIMVWCLKNIRAYSKKQVKKSIGELLSSVNIKAYKSNEARFVRGDWEYAAQIPNDVTHYCLNTTKRLIISWYKRRVDNEAIRRSGSLRHNIKDCLTNLCVIANNVGFSVSNIRDIRDDNWSAGKQRDILYTDKATGETKVLFRVKVFMAGTIHLNMDQDFINYLNVEFGKIKGWVTTPQEAAEEMGMTIEAATKAFNAYEDVMSLTNSNAMLDLKTEQLLLH